MAEVVKKHDHDYACAHNKVHHFRIQNHSLRISTSQIATLTGFHPYASIPQLLFGLIYQGYSGQLLLQHDISLLGLTLVDEFCILNDLASQAGESTVKQLHEALKAHPDTVQTAHQMKEKVWQEAKRSKRLTKKELQFMKQTVRKKVDTQFGTIHEKEALDLYEKKIGWDIRERNNGIMEWKFIQTDDGHGHGHGHPYHAGVIPIGPAQKVSSRTNESESYNIREGLNGGNETSESEKKRRFTRMDQRFTKTDCHSKTLEGETNPPHFMLPAETNTVYSNIRFDPNHKDELRHVSSSSSSSSSSTNSHKDANNKKRPLHEFEMKESQKAFFSILGAIDGIRDELWCDPSSKSDDTSYDEFSHTSDGEWKLRPIIIECKHRMNRAFDPPPLYDQIQAVIYCFMYGVDQADLVQVLRNTNVKPNNTVQSCAYETQSKDKETHKKEKEHMTLNEKSSMMDITVSRISLHDPILQHMQNFYQVILPRLRSIVDATYSIRSNDDKRYRFLFAIAGGMDQSGTSNKPLDVDETNPICEDVIDEEEAWKLVFEECEWLRDCDTLFQRENNKRCVF